MYPNLNLCQPCSSRRRRKKYSEFCQGFRTTADDTGLLRLRRDAERICALLLKERNKDGQRNRFAGRLCLTTFITAVCPCTGMTLVNFPCFRLDRGRWKNHDVAQRSVHLPKHIDEMKFKKSVLELQQTHGAALARHRRSASVKKHYMSRAPRHTGMPEARTCNCDRDPPEGSSLRDNARPTSEHWFCDARETTPLLRTSQPDPVLRCSSISTRASLRALGRGCWHSLS